MANTDNTALLSVTNINKAFPGVKALDDVTFTVKAGTVHGLVGENGAGKSTLMKILRVSIKRTPVPFTSMVKKLKKTTPSESMRSGLAIIYQELNLVNQLSVGENIFLGRFNEMKGMRGIHAKATELLASINSKVSSTTMVGDLSVSEKQRWWEIAKALSFKSKLIIMDEPSSSLTNDEMKQLKVIIQQLKEQGIAIIYISHKLDEIFDFCDEVTILRDGHVIDTKNIEDLTRGEMISKMVGRTIENEYPELPDSVGDVLMEVKNINTRKLHDISFNLHKGEILGLVGLVGAGRTEIVRAIYGADKAKGHTIKLHDQLTPIKNPKDAIKAGFGFVPEDRKLQGLVFFSVESNITMGNLNAVTSSGVISRAKEKRWLRNTSRASASRRPRIKKSSAFPAVINKNVSSADGWRQSPRSLFWMNRHAVSTWVQNLRFTSLMKEIAEKRRCHHFDFFRVTRKS